MTLEDMLPEEFLDWNVEKQDDYLQNLEDTKYDLREPKNYLMREDLED